MTAISGGTSAEQLGASFDQLIADDAVKAVVLDTDSPGGTVQGMEELSSKIAAARGSKPIVAHVNGIAASAAYWVTSGADEVVLSPTAMVGSIGAQTAHDDVSAAMEKAGITRTLITSAPFKNEAASHQPLSDDARAHLQAQVNAFGAMFESRIASNRGIDPAIVRANYGQGRMVMAEQAVAQGMADGIATLDETIARLSAGAAPAKRFAAQREKRALALR